jgi:hypothetical protein
MREDQVQNILFHHFMRLSVNNTPYASVVDNFKGAFDWECDFLGVTWAGYFHEFEIKRSLRDLRREFTHKEMKHRMIKLAQNSKEPMRVPRLFYIVATEFSVPLEEVPDHIGVLHLAGTTVIKQREAKPSNSRKINANQMRKFMTSLMWRYWKLRVERGLK